jgi:hypothetical protein
MGVPSPLGRLYLGGLRSPANVCEPMRGVKVCARPFVQPLPTHHGEARGRVGLISLRSARSSVASIATLFQSSRQRSTATATTQCGLDPLAASPRVGRGVSPSRMSRTPLSPGSQLRQHAPGARYGRHRLKSLRLSHLSSRFWAQLKQSTPSTFGFMVFHRRFFGMRPSKQRRVAEAGELKHRNVQKRRRAHYNLAVAARCRSPEASPRTAGPKNKSSSAR